ncbi:MAG: ABC transporter ATP-binding protein [Candidatus Pacebacteria bacterium]|jgi:ABC-type multidrug transport system fused ATPase/permease subunit|nr:ABC transporter ATP-binding protein [Candidatus Paceibacterota bacterium]
MDNSYLKLFKDFKKFIAPYQNRLVFAMVLQIIASTVYLYWTYGFSQIVNFVSEYTPGASLTPLYTIASALLLVLFIRAVCMGVGRYNLFTNTLRTAIDIREYAIERLSRLDISWHEKENAGNKVKRIESGTDGIRELFRILIVRIVEITVGIVGAIIIIFKFDLFLSITLLLYAIAYYFISSRFRKKMVLARRERNIHDEKYTGLFFEVLNNIRSVKVLNMSKGLLRIVRSTSKELQTIVDRIILLDQSSWSIRVFWEALVRIALIVYIVYGITEGRYEVGFLVLFYGYFSSISGSIEELSSITQEIALSKTNAIRLADMLRVPITIDTDKNKTGFPQDWDKITFKDLSFAYGDSKALSNIDFEIKRGEKIGIVGLSGAGKSTLFKLLLKEHEASEGDIYIGETPLKKIKKSDYLKHVAAVLQETEVFNMSLKKNIELANIDAEKDEELFEKAIGTSHVKDFLNKLPQGIESIIGEKGVKLSGGEKQRVGIARAIFKDPQILLLDEATSHLDVESEGKIKDSLHQFFQNITAIVIAHRLSTIREMDKIIVVEGGRIIESGNFDELYNKDARFREFWDKQALQS